MLDWHSLCSPSLDNRNRLTQESCDLLPALQGRGLCSGQRLAMKWFQGLAFLRVNKRDKLPLFVASPGDAHMRKAVGIAVVLSLCICGFAASKASKQPASSTGILIFSTFTFFIQGDGISTQLAITPRNIPQSSVYSNPPIPHLPLVGIVNGSGECNNSAVSFTASVVGQQLILNLSTAPPSGTIWSCTSSLLFHPQ